MTRLVIFGNSGSGKSSLAREKAELLSCHHLDLDSVAWEAGIDPPTRKSLTKSEQQIRSFLLNNRHWVIEGCYSDLLALAIPFSTEIIFLNPPIETCIGNCMNRPWEAHKYESREAQDANLNMLIDWIKQYPLRQDEFSLTAHRALFDSYRGRKTEYLSNVRNESTTSRPGTVLRI